MTARMLVAFATKRGSTREVAEAVATRLREHGAEVDVVPAADAHEVDGYDAVVLGGSLYMGRWHPDARRFLRRHRDELAERPLAVFALGPLTTAAKDLEGSRRQLEHALGRFGDLEPRTTAVFGGVVHPEQLRFPFSHMPASDARDWDAIRAWADEVAGIASRTPAPA